jgi:hypothetical protein
LAQITLIRLQAAYAKAAALVVADPVFIPIFERLTAEIATFEMQDDIVARARAVLDKTPSV